jgi:CheY-like chemotaxis protein
MRATDIPKVPYTLLLADDSVTIQRVIELTFADEDIQVIAVSDGDQAIQRLDASPPDIVLADIGMPGRNGYEVAQYIKQSPRLAHIPVVLLTGAFEPVDHARASEAGCDGVLAKPFEPQLVIGRVKDLLARPRPVLEAPADSPAPMPVAEAPAESFAPMPTPAASDPAPSSAAPAALDAYFDRLDTAFSNLAAAPAPPIAPAPPTAPAVAEEIDWFGAVKTGAAEPAPEWDVRAPAPVDETPDLPLSFSGPAAPPEVSEAVDEAPVASKEVAQEASAIVEAPTAAPEEPAPPVPVEEVAPPPVLVEQDAPPEPVAPPEPLPESLAPPEPVAPVAAIAPIAVAPAPAAAVHALPTLAAAFAALLAAEKSEGLPAASPAWPAAGPSTSLAVDEVVEQVTRRVLAQLSDRIVRETVADLVSSIAERLVREEIERIKAAIQ